MKQPSKHLPVAAIICVTSFGEREFAGRRDLTAVIVGVESASSLNLFTSSPQGHRYHSLSRAHKYLPLPNYLASHSGTLRRAQHVSF
jgi:hypothetical protein